MFKRWTQTLSVVLFVLIAFSAVQYYFVNQRYQEYTNILKLCDSLEDQMLQVPVEDWATSKERSEWENTCSHAEGAFSDASIAYSVYRSLGGNLEKTLGFAGLVILIIAGSFLARWIVKGSIK